MKNNNTNVFEKLLDLVRGLLPSATYRYDFQKPAQAAALTPSPTPTPQASNKDVLAQNISKSYGQNTPILKDLDLLIQAGKLLEAQGLDPMLPIVMALRETQGGKDLVDPRKNAKLGKSNVYNIRGEQGGTRRFIDYPDLQTATLGGANNGDTSQGFVGLVGKNDIYSDFRGSKNMEDFFRHYSPPTDNNGPLEEQVRNYQWIRNHILGGQ